MFPANAYVIRRATNDDAHDLHKLAELDSQSPLKGPSLVGEIGGRPAAAISLADGRVVADPFQPTAHLIAVLQLRVRSIRAVQEQPSLAARIRAGVRVAGVRTAGA